MDREVLPIVLPVPGVLIEHDVARLDHHVWSHVARLGERDAAAAGSVQEPQHGVQRRLQLIVLRRLRGTHHVDEAQRDLERGGRAVEQCDDVRERRMRSGHRETALARLRRLVHRLEVEEGRVRQHLGEALGVGDATAVLGRGGAATTDGDRARGVLGRGADGLDRPLQLPTVAVVIDVLHAVARLLEGLVQSDLGDGDALAIALLGVEGAQEQLRAPVERVPTQCEAVQVVAGPVERDLQDLVDVREREVRAELETPSDRRGRVLEVDADGQDLRVGQRWATLFRRLRPQFTKASRAEQTVDHTGHLLGGHVVDDLVESSRDVVLRALA